jgi:2-amino-4-hydroxy-6-hydroxymethyldihydropteridine diphosphokinase
VAVVESLLEPPQMLALLQAIEAELGRRRRGRAWSARVLDLDLILWNGGCHACGDLTLPHPHFRSRDFVLHPARRIAADWRDPITGLTVRQLAARLDRRRSHP